VLLVALLSALLTLIPSQWSPAAAAAGAEPSGNYGYENGGPITSVAESRTTAAPHQTRTERVEIERAMGDAVRLRHVHDLGAPRSALSHACSFSGATVVLMADGTTKAIADIEIGDTVLAEDPETGQRGAREVTKLWIHQDQITDLELADGSRVSTTEDHPFWNRTDNEWQRADALDPGDLLLSADGDLLAVDGMDPTSTRTTTAYNLTVDDIHTYFVRIGTEDILVHNNNTCGLGGVYTLTDDVGNIVRTGRTNNVVRREAEHLRQFGDDFRFDTVFRTDDLATQRGLEQILYNRNPSARLVNGGLNRIRPISVRNPRTLVYEDAAARYLQQLGLN
jgi:hypothetical protein